jgi:hypothetical protein
MVIGSGGEAMDSKIKKASIKKKKNMVFGQFGMILLEMRIINFMKKLL